VKEIVAVDKPAFIYDFGDYDAAGWFSSEHINDMLTDYAAKAGFAQPIAFERVALHTRTTSSSMACRPATARSATTMADRSRARPPSAPCRSGFWARRDRI
jgi:hypothetical protein